MTHPFPPPPIQPFERLQAADGLLINAERWRKAHDYHRQRQNVHYQSVNQPGIVCGLGVRDIPAPAKVDAQYRDGRWVQIQPGIAIDLVGNLIVVPKTIDFRIATVVAESEPVTVYLVVSYVDPDELRRDGRSEVVKENFRVDEKSNKPGALEVEICRILLQAGAVSIEQPKKDVFFPGYNEIDLRYRTQAQARPQAIVRVAQVNNDDDPESTRSFFYLPYLLQAVEALYPSLRGADEVGQVDFKNISFENIQEYDLLYLTGKQALEIKEPQFEALKKYLDKGGAILVDAPPDATALIESTQKLAQDKLGYPLEELRRNHPLRTRPFLFAALPMVNQQLIRFLIGGGIILAVGDLAAAWGPDQALTLSRVTIRTAQELGINILQYAWKRRQLIGLQQEDYSGQW